MSYECQLKLMKFELIFEFMFYECQLKLMKFGLRSQFFQNH
jgi:hypothetical protein